jgi:hypothetical protein
MQKCNTHSAFALKNTLQQDMQTTEAFCIRIPPQRKTALPLSVEAKFSSSFLFLPPPSGGHLLLAFPCVAPWSTGAAPLLTSGKLDTFPCTAARRAGAPPSPTRRRPPHRAPVTSMDATRPARSAVGSGLWRFGHGGDEFGGSDRRAGRIGTPTCMWTSASSHRN